MIREGPTTRVFFLVLAMEMLQVVWKQHLRPRAVVGYGVKIFLPSPPNYVTRSPGVLENTTCNIGLRVQSLQSARRKVDY